MPRMGGPGGPPSEEPALNKMPRFAGPEFMLGVSKGSLKNLNFNIGSIVVPSHACGDWRTGMEVLIVYKKNI